MRFTAITGQSVLDLPEEVSTEAAPLPPTVVLKERDHLVQFYESDDYLVSKLSQFVATALVEGGAVVVFATKGHLDALEKALSANDHAVAQLKAKGRLHLLDGATILSTCMVHGQPDAHRFHTVIGGIVKKAAHGGRKVYAFNGMSALLWEQGNHAGTINLEELWNELERVHPCSLMCAYPLHSFDAKDLNQPFLQICKCHARVLPTENYSTVADENQRLRIIAELQQKAASLAAEIDERNKVELALRAQQTKLGMAVAIAHLGVWELDLVTNQITTSDEVKLQFGVPLAEQLSLRRLFELIHPDDQIIVRNAVQSTLMAGKDYAAEFRVIRPDGELRWLSAMGRCMSGGVDRILGASVDITARKKAAEVLEKTVAQRTAALHETIADLEAFSYSISHDMRAPLRAMRCFSEILTKECSSVLQGENLDYLNRISAASLRMDQLIQDVLSFSRISRADVRAEPVDLDGLIRGILDSYPNFQRPSVEIKIEGQLPVVFGNPAALTQCISNLLANAIKFVAPDTRARVVIWANIVKSEDATGPNEPATCVRLYLKDNGIGIPGHQHERIFGIFQQLHRNYEGTGIGLSIVKKAMERMGGKVGLTSSLGQGSTFWLELPRAFIAEH